MAKPKKCTKSKLTIKFSNPEAAEHFKVWLCQQGKHDYWTWMEEREMEDPDKEIVVRRFEYHESQDPNILETTMYPPLAIRDPEWVAAQGVD